MATRPLRVTSASRAPREQRLAARWWEQPGWESPSAPQLPTDDDDELVESLFGTAIADPLSRIGSALRWVTRPQWDHDRPTEWATDLLGGDDTPAQSPQAPSSHDPGRVS